MNVNFMTLNILKLEFSFKFLEPRHWSKTANFTIFAPLNIIIILSIYRNNSTTKLNNVMVTDVRTKGILGDLES